MSLQPFSTEPVTLAEEVFPGDTNAYGTLFGGRLMALMDKAAGFSSSKFAHREFVTVSVDSLEFINPAHKGDIIEVVGKVVYTSTHSAGCKVQAYALSNLTGSAMKSAVGISSLSPSMAMAARCRFRNSPRTVKLSKRNGIPSQKSASIYWPLGGVVKRKVEVGVTLGRLDDRSQCGDNRW